MKKQHDHKIDELFSRKLEGFQKEPGEEVWLNIRSQLPKGPENPGSSSGFRISPDSGIFYTFTAISLFLTGLGAFYILSRPATAIMFPMTENTKLVTTPLIASTPETTHSQTSTTTYTTVPTDQPIKAHTPANKGYNTPPAQLPVPYHPDPVAHHTITPAKQTLPSNQDIDPNPGMNEQTLLQTSDPVAAQYETSGLAPAAPSSFSALFQPERMMSLRTPLTTEFASALPTGLSEKKSSWRRPDPLLSRFSVGAYYLPEAHYNLNDPLSGCNGTRNTVTPMLSLEYDAKNFLITAGVSSNRFKESIPNLFHYNCNEITGSYLEVDSVDFDLIFVDSIWIPVVDTMYVHSVLIYENVNHNEYISSSRTFSYIQIPFTFSYRKYFGKWAVSAGAGVNVSLLMQKKETEAVLDKEATILSSEKFSSPLIKTNTQLLGVLGFSYAIRPRIWLSAEPQFRYYFKSLYTGEDNGKTPFSIGIRTGIKFNF